MIPEMKGPSPHILTCKSYREHNLKLEWEISHAFEGDLKNTMPVKKKRVLYLSVFFTRLVIGIALGQSKYIKNSI